MGRTLMSDSSPLASPGSPASMASSVPRKSPDSMSSSEERNGIGAFDPERGFFGQERVIFNQDRSVLGIPHLQQPTIKVRDDQDYPSIPVTKQGGPSNLFIQSGLTCWLE